MLVGLGPFIQASGGLPAPNDDSIDITTETYSNLTFDFSANSNNPRDVAFSPLGEHMYITDNSDSRIYQYNFSTGYDLSTGSFANSFSTSSQDSNPRGVAFNQEGTKMFVVARFSNSIYQYNFTTPWDISTASYSGNSFNVSTQATGPEGLEFSPDGTRCIVCDNGTDGLYQYNLTTGYDLSTMSYSGNSRGINSQDGGMTGVRSNSTGTVLVTLGFNTTRIYQYDLSTGFDLSTAVYNFNNFSVDAEDSIPTGLELNYFGDKIYMVGQFSEKVHQYNLS